MINRTHDLPIGRQCQLLKLSRATAYYQPKPVSAAELALRHRTDELHLAYPFAGARMVRDLLRGEGHTIGRKRVRSVMARLGIEALYRKPTTSQRHPAHPVYPYRLRDLAITRSNQVWAADITYIPMQRGFVYLFAVLDWASRRVLAWRLSKHPDDRLLPGGGPGGPSHLWHTGHLQHRPRLPVHQPGVHGTPDATPHRHQHGW